MTTGLPWIGPPPPTVCPDCGGAAIEWSAQVLCVTDPPGNIYGPGKAFARQVTRMECVDCRDARERRDWVELLVRGGAAEAEAEAFVAAHYHPGTRSLVFKP